MSPFEYHVIVRGVSGRRGPASVAQELYEETAEGKAQRELHAERLRSAPPPIFQEKGRPTKRDRRALRRLKDGE